MSATDYAIEFDALRDRIVAASHAIMHGQSRAATLAELRSIRRATQELLRRNVHVRDADTRASNDRFLRRVLARLHAFESLLVGDVTWGQA